MVVPVNDCGQPLLVGGDGGLAAGLVDLHPHRPVGRRLLHPGQPDRAGPGRLASATTTKTSLSGNLKVGNKLAADCVVVYVA